MAAEPCTYLKTVVGMRTPSAVHLKMVKMANFMLCTFYHNKKAWIYIYKMDYIIYELYVIFIKLPKIFLY